MLKTIEINSLMYIEALLDGKEILFLYLLNHEINPDEDDKK